MKTKINIDLIEVIRFKLGLLGEKIDESKENKTLYVAHSCNLLDDTTIQWELDDYMVINNLNVFDATALNNLSQKILNKHILNENSNHSIENKSEVFRKN